MIAKWEEKRSFPRINLKTALRCQVRGTQEFNNVVSDDISAGGVSFVNESFIVPQTRVNLEINLLSRMINTTGRIIRANPLAHSNKYRWGVEFLEIDPLQKKYLSAYMNMQIGKL